MTQDTIMGITYQVIDVEGLVAAEEAAAAEGGLCLEVENDWNADRRL